MRKSRAVTLSLLGTAGFALGCGGSNPTEPHAPTQPAPPVSQPQQPPQAPDPHPVGESSEILFEPDDQWFDAAGNPIPIPVEWRDDGAGGRVPVRHPHDAIGRPWEFGKDGTLVPPPPVVLRATPLIGDLVLVHAVSAAGGRSPTFSTIARGGFGGIGGRTAGG